MLLEGLEDNLPPSLLLPLLRRRAEGRIELGSVGSLSLVSLAPTEQGWTLGYEEVQNFHDIQLSGHSNLWVEDIQLAGRRVTLTDSSIRASDLIIKAEQFIAQGASIRADSFEQGENVNVTLTASDFIELTDGTSLHAGASIDSFDKQGEFGNGNIVINTRRLVVQDSSVSASNDELKIATSGNQIGFEASDFTFNLPESLELQGGNVTVKASESVEVIDSSLDVSGTLSLVYPDPPREPQELFVRSPGNLTITTGKLIVRDGARFSGTSTGVFPGANLVINASEFVRVTGSNLSAEFFFEGTINLDPDRYDLLGLITYFSSEFFPGMAGSIVINTPQLSIEDGAVIRVSNQYTGNAGEIEITARTVLLDNEGKLLAETVSGQGGNITLQAQDLLLLRRNSQISTTAGTEQAGGDGGNITIDTDNLVALENSDITANAFQGRGGRVEIAAQGIFGTEARERQTSESDITASSNLGPQFSGIVEFNTPDVDPTQRLVNLPAEVVDVSNQIAQTCPAGGGQGQSKFTVAGRGGLPPNSSEALSSEPVRVDWVTLNPRVENAKNPTVSSNPTTPEPASLVEAQGWVTNALGEVVLTAHAPTVTPHNSWQRPAECHAPQNSS